MHAYSLWWKLFAGSSHKAPASQAKAKTRHGTKTKSTKQAHCGRRTTAPPASSASGTGGPEHGPRGFADTEKLGASGDGIVRTLLKAISIRRLKAMTSRSRVCGNPKYKVNNQNLEKFEQLLSKIPEGEKLKGTTSLTSLPERHDDVSRTTVAPAPLAPSAPPVLPVPDISPSTTMGSSVTAEYELFCKTFHSEAKQLLPEEEQQKVCGNPMRQLLQSASEAAARGLQLQRVTSAFGATDSPRDTRTIDGTNSNGAALKAPDMAVVLAGGQTTPDSVIELPAITSPQPARVPSREKLAQQLQADQAEQRGNKQPRDQKLAGTRQRRSWHQEHRQSRRWSENPVGTPIFMAKKFAEKLSKSKDMATQPPTTTATPVLHRNSSTLLLKALKPKLPFSSSKPSSKQTTPPLMQPQKPAVGGSESPQPSTSASTPKYQSDQQISSLNDSKQ